MKFYISSECGDSYIINYLKILKEYNLSIITKESSGGGEYKEHYIEVTSLESLMVLKTKLGSGITIYSTIDEVVPNITYKDAIYINDMRR